MNLIKLNKRKSPQVGFSLIEVLIGIAIAGVGIVGVIELQKLYMQSTTQANARVIAMKLATEKLEDTKSIAYTDLAASAEAESDNVAHKVATFSRKWKVSNRYYVDGAWQTGTADLDPVPTRPDAKVIDVTVSWSDSNGNAQYVNQTKYISKTNGTYESSLEDITLGGGAPPKVEFHSLGDLENPSISLLDPDATDRTDVLSKETSKPEPKVSQRENLHRVQFETVVYDSINDTQTLEDFATVNCDCSFSEGKGKTPTTLKLDDGRLINDPESGKEIDKEHGDDTNSGLEPLCTKCCANHHDDVDAPARYKASGINNHNHYKLDGSGALVKSSDAYLEACRFKRIDGFYELVPDWVLIDLIVLPKSFFTDTTNGISNSEAYTTHVKRVIKAHILGQTLPNSDTLKSRVADFSVGASQLVARGIYIDLASLSEEDISLIKTEISSNIKWLELVPFYDVNLTLFARWTVPSTDIDIATVTNEPIKTIVNTEQDYYGTYSRGRLLSKTNGSTSITAEVNIDNTGITGTRPIIPALSSTIRIRDILPITIGSNGNKSITIEVECTKEITRGQTTEIVSCPKGDLTVDNVLIAVLPSSAQLDCTFTPQHPNTSFISCTNIPANWSGSIEISKEGYTANLGAIEGFDKPVFDAGKFHFGESAYNLEAEGQSTPTFQVHLKNY